MISALYLEPYSLNLFNFNSQYKSIKSISSNWKNELDQLTSFETRQANVKSLRMQMAYEILEGRIW